MARGEEPLLERAVYALDHVHDDPVASATAAAEVRAEAEATGDLVAASVAGRALGIALRDSGDLDGGGAALGAAVDAAERGGARREAALARLSMVAVHILAGREAEARAVAARAEADLDVVDGAALLVQLAVLDERAGRYTAAVAAYDRAEGVLAEHDDPRWLVRVCANRSVALAELGRLDDAVRDGERALDALGPSAGPLRAVIDLNRAWFAALAADVPTALARYDTAAASARQARYPVGTVLRDRAELLTTVGMWPEAVAAGTEAVRDLDRTGPVDAAEARLVLAAALAGRGDTAAAEAVASEAAAAFAQQGRPVWAARARVRRGGIAVRHSAAGAGATEVTEVLAAGRVLRDAGLEVEWLEARATAVQLALRAGADPPEAALPLVPPVGPPWVRARAWLAEAERRLAAGNRTGAARAAGAGLRPLETLRTTLGSVDLRAGLAATADELAELLVATARGGRPRQLLQAAERRVGQPIRLDAPAGGPLATALAAMRAAAGRAAGATDPDELGVALRGLATAEADVTRLTRQAGGRAAAGAGHRLDPAELTAALGDGWALVRYVVARTAVLAVTVDSRGSRRYELGPVAPLVAAGERLRAALARQARTRAPRAAVAVQAAATDLHDALVAPLLRRLGDRRVVVVPDGPLHGVAWAALPGFAARPLTVSPSVASWLAATAAAPRTDGRGVFVAGPDLHHVTDEVSSAADAWRRAGREAAVLTGRHATVAEVLTAMDGCDLAHLACHGHVRADAPPFSSLDLADGPLTGIDLDLLGAAPAVVLLAACDVGATSATGGTAEILGFPGWLLRAGSRSVVASTVPVPDDAGAVVFGGIAASLAAGIDPADAVAAACVADPAVGSGLVCVGAGR